MRRVALLSTAAVVTVSLAACGLSLGGLGSPEATDGGSTADGTVGEAAPFNDAGGGFDDSMTENDSPEDAAAQGDAGFSCEVSAGCYIIPSGWQLTAFVDNQTSPCPSGFGNPTNWVEGPSACSCGPCSVTQSPACDTGPISNYYSLLVANCSTSGDTVSNKDAGACNSDGYTGPLPYAYSTLYLKYVPTNQPTDGGQCVVEAGAQPLTYAFQDQTCQPTPAVVCNGNQCTPNVPAPYQTCISKAGDSGCPAASPFTQSHTVGTVFNSQGCSDCTCSVTASCNGGTMELFTNSDCTGTEFDVPADGGCDTTLPKNTTYDSYKYVANSPTVACKTTVPSTLGSFQQETTICCAP